jgi:hypothetical protein
MKRLKTFLLLLAVALCSVNLVIPDHPKYSTHDGNGILLVYTGTMSGKMNLSIGIHVEIDSLVGVRYEVVFESGSNTMSHTALFYKFSDPKETIFYNYLSHKSTVNKCCGSSGSGSNVSVVGQEFIDSFSCTHLQGTNNSESGAEDYWVSTSVPGYSELLKILNNISPGLQQMFIEGNIFQWGGLVKMTSTLHNQVSVVVKLAEANSSMSFPARDFDVPSK